jgi:hypothetical protein
MRGLGLRCRLIEIKASRAAAMSSGAGNRHRRTIMPLETLEGIIFVVAVFAFFMTVLAYADLSENRKSRVKVPHRKN